MPDINSGWIHDPKEIEKIMAETPEPYFFQAGNVLTSSGKGKSAFLYKSFKKLGIPYPKPLQSSTGDCVSHASAIAVDTLSVCEIAAGERETWEARAASEYIYSISRVIIGGNRFSGDGSVNAFAVKGMRDYGTLRRKKYNSIDLTVYNPTRARQWGSQKMSTELIELAKPNNITKFAAISNFEEACDALYNGYPIIVASSQGFASRRDTDGFAAPQGKWMHSMAIIGYKDDNRPGVLIQNSWPGYLAGPNPHDLPDSAFWCDADVFNRMCKFQDTFSIAGFNGFQLRANARVL